MKQFFTIMAVCFAIVAAEGQIEWAKTGTRWVYYEDAFGSDVITQFESIGDTLIQGKTCHIIERKENWPFYGRELYFSYEDNGQVFFLNKQDGTFLLLYDFTKEPGEQWQVPFNSPDIDTLVFMVDSVRFATQGNQTLKIQHVHTNPTDSCGAFIVDEIVSDIGSRTFFTPVVSCLTVHIYTQLACFKSPDNEVIQFSNTWLNCDSLTTSIQNPVSKNAELLVYPNPSTTETTLTYRLPPGIKGELRIFNALGKQFAEYPATQSEGTLTLPDYPAGLYFVSLFSEERMLHTRRLLKFKK